jgi:hypothetical protein
VSLHRHAAKRDGNEPGIVLALRQVGATVQRLSGENVPDLLVGFRGATYLLEVKSADRDLSDGQTRWMLEWRGGPCRPVWTVQDALEVVGALEVTKGVKR